MPQTQVSHSVPAHHTTHVNFAAAAMVAIVGTFLSGLPRNRQGNNLAQANELVTQGKLQSEIARTLGVSVMTLHRWRKAPPQPALVATAEDRARGADDRIAELQLENSRLRRLVTDLLLEKVKLEETAKVKVPSREGTRRAFR
jgi:putative transposase